MATDAGLLRVLLFVVLLVPLGDLFAFMRLFGGLFELLVHGLVFFELLFFGLLVGVVAVRRHALGNLVVVLGVAVLVEPVVDCGSGNGSARARQHQGGAIFVGHHHFGGLLLVVFVRLWFLSL